MAKLGVRTVDELVGHTEKIRVRSKRTTHRAETIDLSAILGEGTGESYHYEESAKFNFELEKTIDEAVLIPEFAPYFKNKRRHEAKIEVSSTNRTVGTILGSVITKRFGTSLDDDMYVIHAKGGGGQSSERSCRRDLRYLSRRLKRLLRKGSVRRKTYGKTRPALMLCR